MTILREKIKKKKHRNVLGICGKRFEKKNEKRFSRKIYFLTSKNFPTWKFVFSLNCNKGKK